MAKHVRICAGESCKVRMSALESDGHSRCATCIGKECKVDDRCEECIGWNIDKMNTFIKNRRDKELCRARKAKRRLGLREQGKQQIGSLLVQPDRKVASSAHSMSSSSSALIINQSDDSLLVSDLSTSHASITSAASNPDRGQVITRSEFDALGNSVQLLTQQMAIFFLAKQSSQVPSDTPLPLVGQTSGPISVCMGDGVDPEQATKLLSSHDEAEDGPDGDPAKPESCPSLKSDMSERARKRSRKDVSAKVKRSRTRPPSRPRESHSVAINPTVDELPPVSGPSPPSHESPPVDTAVPPVSQAAISKGSFYTSMSDAIVSLVKSAMCDNPKLSTAEAVQLASEHVRKTDPLNVSYRSSRSCLEHQGSQRRLNETSFSENTARCEESILSLEPDSVQAPVCAITTPIVTSAPLITSVGSDSMAMSVRPKIYSNRSRSEASFEAAASSTPRVNKKKYSETEVRVLDQCFGLSSDGSDRDQAANR